MISGLGDCQTDMSEVTASVVSTVGDAFNVFRENTQAAAKACMTEDGAGAAFASQASEWQTIVRSEDVAACKCEDTKEFFTRLVDETRYAVQLNETNSGEAMLGFQEAITSFKTKVSIFSRCVWSSINVSMQLNHTSSETAMTIKSFKTKLYS